MTMLKQYKKTLLITSALILLPIAVGLLLWDQLPATMNIHWNASGEADGAAGKGFAIFFMPLFLLGMHWFCALITHLTNRGNDQNEKAMKIVLWMMPILSNVITCAMYAAALGLEINMGKIIFAPMGILFIVIGNFLPKVRRNSTLGIKTAWSLADVILCLTQISQKTRKPSPMNKAHTDLTKHALFHSRVSAPPSAYILDGSCEP